MPQSEATHDPEGGEGAATVFCRRSGTLVRVATSQLAQAATFPVAMPWYPNIKLPLLFMGNVNKRLAVMMVCMSNFL